MTTRAAKSSSRRRIEPSAHAKPRDATWNFHERHDGKHGVISEWKRSIQVAIRAKLDRTLHHLHQMPKNKWHKPAPASALGDHIYVIRFTDITGMQIRLFGHFHDPHHAFVMTLVGHEKDGQYVPANYQALAQRHRAHCSQDFQVHTQPYGNRCAICAECLWASRH